MPVRLSEIVAQERWVTAEIAGVEVKFAYRPNALTLRRSNELERLQSEIDQGDIDVGVELARMFCDMIGSWDILDEDDAPYPITVDTLQDFPASVIMAILGALNDDISRLSTEKKVLNGTSGAILRPAASLASARTGSR